MVAPVSQIVFRSGIAAVNDSDKLRVYSQDVLGGIREATFDGTKWSGATDTLVTAKVDSHIAVASKGVKNIRIYYLTPDNKLAEYAYDSGSWYSGALTKSGFSVAPYSSVAAVYLPSYPGIRVYAQNKDDTIQEFVNDGSSSWTLGANLGAALPGTSIATTAFSGTHDTSIRTYFQDTNLNIIEKAFNSGNSWVTGNLSVKNAVPRASLAATSFNVTKSGESIRIYYSDASNAVLEKGWDAGGNWYDGNFKQTSIPGSKVTAVSWGTGDDVQLRIYLQNGTAVTAVSEWAYTHGWSAGAKALPPA